MIFVILSEAKDLCTSPEVSMLPGSCIGPSRKERAQDDKAEYQAWFVLNPQRRFARFFS